MSLPWRHAPTHTWNVHGEPNLARLDKTVDKAYMHMYKRAAIGFVNPAHDLHHALIGWTVAGGVVHGMIACQMTHSALLTENIRSRFDIIAGALTYVIIARDEQVISELGWNIDLLRKCVDV